MLDFEECWTAVENRDAGAGFEFNVQVERSGFPSRRETLLDPRLDHAGLREPNGLGLRRFTTVSTAIAINEMVTTSVRAAVPLPDSTAS